MTRLAVLFILLQINVVIYCMSVEHLTQEDVRCCPYNFVYARDEREFLRLMVVPHLHVESLRDLSRLEIVPEGNSRYNDFLSCIWMNRQFQTLTGHIDFGKVENAITTGIGNLVGNTGPGFNLGKLEAERMVDQCNDLGGNNPGNKVIRVRNCILKRIKKFVEELDENSEQSHHYRADRRNFHVDFY